MGRSKGAGQANSWPSPAARCCAPHPSFEAAAAGERRGDMQGCLWPGQQLGPFLACLMPAGPSRNGVVRIPAWGEGARAWEAGGKCRPYPHSSRLRSSRPVPRTRETWRGRGLCTPRCRVNPRTPSSSPFARPHFVSFAQLHRTRGDVPFPGFSHVTAVDGALGSRATEAVAPHPPPRAQAWCLPSESQQWFQGTLGPLEASSAGRESRLSRPDPQASSPGQQLLHPGWPPRAAERQLASRAPGRPGRAFHSVC